MAGGGPEFGSNGRKSLNAEVNLVPFIDLLSVCICFLLMTAVWVQLGTIDVKQTFGTSAGNPQDAYELELRFRSPEAAEIVVKQKGRSEKPLLVKGENAEALPKALHAKVKEMVAKRGVPASAILNPHKDVAHGEIVDVMDVLRRNKIVSLGIASVGAGM